MMRPHTQPDGCVCGRIAYVPQIAQIFSDIITNKLYEL